MIANTIINPDIVPTIQIIALLGLSFSSGIIGLSITLKTYSGVRRRFELKYKTKSGLHIVDDYAHHPSEVKATIEAAKMGWNNDVLFIW